MIKSNLVQYLVAIDLQLFADGGASGTDGGGQTGETGTAAVSQEGVNAQVTDVQTQDADGVDRNAKFEELIKGEYKDLYDKKMQDTIQKRLKSAKETVDKYESLAPTLDMLAEKYGVDASDIDALNKAIEDDESYYEEESLERGLPIEEIKAERKIKRALRKAEEENAALKKQMQEQESQKKAAQLYASWMEQAESLKTIYPSFNLETELKNPQFMDLLRVPTINVRTAYEVIHKDEIIHGAMQYTAKTVKEKVANNIMANGARPIENGTSSQSASLTKSDVSQLSNSQLDEIIKRVQRGDKIYL